MEHLKHGLLMMFASFYLSFWHCYISTCKHIAFNKSLHYCLCVIEKQTIAKYFQTGYSPETATVQCKQS